MRQSLQFFQNYDTIGMERYHKKEYFDDILDPERLSARSLCLFSFASGLVLILICL